LRKIPFLDLKKVHNKIQPEINKCIRDVANSGFYLLNKKLYQFEDSYGKFEKVKHVVGVGSGLDALTMLLISLNVKAGDEVIVPSHTFIATWIAVVRVGAIPIPVEPNELTYNIDVNLIKRAITSNTKAIIVVNLYGQIADLQPIREICDENKLFLLEDAAQSHGALYKGDSSSIFSDAAATSFYPGKNLGCMSDGGAVLTNNIEIANKIKRLRNYGSDKKYEHLELGFNSRLDEIQSAILTIKMKHLKDMNSQREKIAKFYNKNLSTKNLILPFKLESVGHAWHLYVVRTKNRDYLQKKLLEDGIQTIIHYPIPPYRQKCFNNIKFETYKLTDKICSEILSLPIYPYMPKSHIEYVVSQVNKYSS